MKAKYINNLSKTQEKSTTKTVGTITLKLNIVMQETSFMKIVRKIHFTIQVTLKNI